MSFKKGGIFFAQMAFCFFTAKLMVWWFTYQFSFQSFESTVLMFSTIGTLGLCFGYGYDLYVSINTLLTRAIIWIAITLIVIMLCTLIFTDRLKFGDNLLAVTTIAQVAYAFINLVIGKLYFYKDRKDFDSRNKK